MVKGVKGHEKRYETEFDFLQVGFVILIFLNHGTGFPSKVVASICSAKVCGRKAYTGRWAYLSEGPERIITVPVSISVSLSMSLLYRQLNRV